MRHKLFYLLVAFATLVFSSCDPSGLDATKKENATTYTITYNCDNRAIFRSIFLSVQQLRKVS